MKKIAHHRLAKGVWQALLINNLSFVVESYLETDRHSKFAESYCDKIFDPLETWELPKESEAGSGTALKNPCMHLLKNIRQSFSSPWPFGGHLTGIRQTLLSPPPQRPSSLPLRPPPFHRLSVNIKQSHLGRTLSAISGSRSRLSTPAGSRAPSPTLPEEKIEAGVAAVVENSDNPS